MHSPFKCILAFFLFLFSFQSCLRLCTKTWKKNLFYGVSEYYQWKKKRRLKNGLPDSTLNIVQQVGIELQAYQPHCVLHQLQHVCHFHPKQKACWSLFPDINTQIHMSWQLIVVNIRLQEYEFPQRSISYNHLQIVHYFTNTGTSTWNS